MRSERPGGTEPACREVAELLPGVVDASAVLDARAAHHVESCLRCQAELAQYRRLQRALRRLHAQAVEPAPGLLADVLASLADPRWEDGAGSHEALPARRHGRTAAYLGGLAVATAAAGAAVVLRSGRKPSRAS